MQIELKMMYKSGVRLSFIEESREILRLDCEDHETVRWDLKMWVSRPNNES